MNVTGWALRSGTLGIASVNVYREAVAGEGGGLIFLGGAPFIAGARPDVKLAFPGYANNDWGWGMQVLTNMLPGTDGRPRGNGTYRLHVYAVDANNVSVEIGSARINVDNASSVQPFGTIDTPAPGQQAGGTAFVNSGWALTPQPASIPTNGSTITVWIDGQPKGHPVYGQNRPDIAALFPGYANSATAGGSFAFDTTGYSFGLHTIAWTVTDSAGHAEGIGSRYWTAANIAFASAVREAAVVNSWPIRVYNDGREILYAGLACSGAADCRTLACSVTPPQGVTLRLANQSQTGANVVISAESGAAAGTRSMSCSVNASGWTLTSYAPLYVYDATPVINVIANRSRGGTGDFAQGEGSVLVRIGGRNFGTSGQLAVTGPGVTVQTPIQWSPTEILAWFQFGSSASVGPHTLTVTAATGNTGSSFLSRPADPFSQNIATGLLYVQCRPAIGSLQLNGQNTRTLIRGTSGRIRVLGSCLANVNAVAISGMATSSWAMVNATAIDIDYRSDASTALGAHDVTVASAPTVVSNAAQVLAAQVDVTEVSYLGGLTITKDLPGSSQVIMNPIWKSTNTAAQNDPAAYVRGQTMTAAVKLVVTPAWSDSVSGVRVEGAIAGLGKFVATDVTLPNANAINVTADTVLPSMTKYYNPMTVNWSVGMGASPCASNCAAVGTSANKVYVTLAQPTVSTIYLTTLNLALSYDGATNPSQAFENTWQSFADDNLERPRNIVSWDGLRLLSYYPQGYGFSNSNNPDRCQTTEAGLLTAPIYQPPFTVAGGECGSFARLLMSALAINGIPSEFTTIQTANGSLMAVKAWEFGLPTAESYDYPWSWTPNPEALANGDYMVPPPVPDPNDYGGLRSLTGIPGQNGQTPSEKVFARHFVVRVGSSVAPNGKGPCFDPSYGRWYSGPADFAAKAVAGYVVGLGLGRYAVGVPQSGPPNVVLACAP